MAVEDDDNAPLDLNTDPVFVHVYPGSRVLEMALPSSPRKMNEIHRRLTSKQVIDTSNRISRVTKGNNVMDSAMVTTLQAKIDNLVDNQAVSVIFFTSRSPDVFSSGLFPDFQSFPGSSSPSGTAASSASSSVSSSKSSVSAVHGSTAVNNNDVIRFQDDFDGLTTDTLAAINKLALTIHRVSAKDSRKSGSTTSSMSSSSSGSGSGSGSGSWKGAKQGSPSSSPSSSSSSPSSSSSSSSSTATVAVYGGALTGTAYAVFAGCDFLLATGATEFSLPEVALGVLPAGGTAYYLAQSCVEGVALGRYLAITGGVLRWVEALLGG